MDKQAKHFGRETLEQAVAALRQLGLEAHLTPTPLRTADRADARLEVQFGKQRMVYTAAVKRHLRPATIGAVLHQLGRLEERPMLVADHVTPVLAEKLRAQGVAFIDTAGNAYLEEPPLLVWVTGRRPPDLPHNRAEGRAFQASGLQVLFALLCKPEIVDLPYRRIAQYAGVAHGTVGWVMAELPKLGYITKFRKRRVLMQPERLLARWAEGYAQTLRPKLLLDRFRTDDLTWWQVLDPATFPLLLGGEPAGAKLTKYLRPARITLYGDRIDPKFVAHFKLRREEPGNVEVLKRFWNFVEDVPGLVPAPLVYADLLATGETRCLETAERIYEGIVNGFEREG